MPWDAGVAQVFEDLVFKLGSERVPGVGCPCRGVVAAGAAMFAAGDEECAAVADAVDYVEFDVAVIVHSEFVFW